MVCARIARCIQCIHPKTISTSNEPRQSESDLSLLNTIRVYAIYIINGLCLCIMGALARTPHKHIDTHAPVGTRAPTENPQIMPFVWASKWVNWTQPLLLEINLGLPMVIYNNNVRPIKRCQFVVQNVFGPDFNSHWWNRDFGFLSALRCVFFLTNVEIKTAMQKRKISKRTDVRAAERRAPTWHNGRWRYTLSRPLSSHRSVHLAGWSIKNVNYIFKASKRIPLNRHDTGPRMKWLANGKNTCIIYKIWCNGKARLIVFLIIILDDT